MDEAASKVRLDGFSMPENIRELEHAIEQRKEELEQALMEQRFEDASGAKAEKQAAEAKYQKLVKKYHRDAERKKLTVGENEIAEVVSGWTKIPVKKLAEGEAARLSPPGKDTS